MQIRERDYKIIRDDIPVPTLQDDGSYAPTNCLLVEFNIRSAVITEILKPFEFTGQFLRVIDHFDNPVLHALTNANITTDNFNPSEDILSLAIHDLCGANNPACGILFETNYKYRSDGNSHYNIGAKYTHCGEPLLRAFQKLYANRGITCRAPIGVYTFYTEHGFTQMPGTESHFQYGPVNTGTSH